MSFGTVSKNLFIKEPKIRVPKTILMPKPGSPESNECKLCNFTYPSYASSTAKAHFIEQKYYSRYGDVLFQFVLESVLMRMSRSTCALALSASAAAS